MKAQSDSIAFVQVNSAVPQTAQISVPVTYTKAQMAGDLNVVVVGWNNSTSQISSVVDSKGNVYVLAVGPTIQTGLASQAIYCSSNIAAATANGNTVTVTFNSSAPAVDIRIAEYSGISPTAPVDLVVAAQGNSSASSSGSVTTKNVNDLLVAANYVQTITTSAGTGYTSRVITSPDGDILEDRTVTATGSYSATATLTSGWWIMQMVAFRNASGGTPLPTLSSVAPNNGPTVGGTAVTITGTNFAAGATVTFGETVATNVVVVSSTTITTTAPAGTAGVVTVTVTVDGQSGGLANGYTYLESASGLVAAYSFNEGTGTTVSDASGNGNTGTIVNATWTTAGKYGDALEFNGTNAWVMINDAASLDLTTGMTLEVWVNPFSIPLANCTPNATCPWMDVVYKDIDCYYIEGSSNNNGGLSSQYGEPEAGGIFADGKHIVFGPSALPLNTWTHLALTYDSTMIRFYVNGSLVASSPESTPITKSTSPLFIGGDQTMGQFFNGVIDEVRVYNVALTAAQIQSDMNTPIGSGVSNTQPPTAPSNLIATARSSSQINLSWSASTSSAGLANYIVQRCQETSCTSFTQVASFAATTTAYNDTGLTAGLSYSYRVQASDTAGNLSPYSNVVSAATLPDTQPPTVPTNLTALAVGSSQVNLNWTASTDNVGVVGYHIFRDGLQIATATALSYTDTTLSASTTFTYAVSAFDAAGNTSALSTPVSVTTQAVAAGVPTLVQHVATGMDNQFVNSLTISLPNPSGAGNALILGVRFNGAGSIALVSDNEGNNWVVGPTVLNSTSGAFVSTRMSTYYALNVHPGTQTITVAFNGLGGPTGYQGFPQAVLSEFFNIAAVSAFDGGSFSPSSRTADTFTTTANGDLIYEWGADISAMDGYNGALFNGTTIIAGSGFTLLSSDLQTGSADQYMVQSAAGEISPTFSASGSDTWSSVALALRSGQAGTPPPQTGIRIVHIQHEMLEWPGQTSPVTLAFPSTGNLLVAMFTSPTSFVASITDSNGNHWVSAASTPGDTNIASTSAQILYAANANTGPALSSIRTVLTQACAGGCNLVLYDIAGATTSPYDTSIAAFGDQQSAGPVAMASLNPASPNELVLAVGAIDFHTINSVEGISYVLDSVVNAFDDDSPPIGTSSSRLDEDNAFAHINNPTASPVTFVFKATTTTSDGIQGWGAVASAFK